MPRTPARVTQADIADLSPGSPISLDEAAALKETGDE